MTYYHDDDEDEDEDEDDDDDDDDDLFWLLIKDNIIIVKPLHQFRCNKHIFLKHIYLRNLIMGASSALSLAPESPKVSMVIFGISFFFCHCYFHPKPNPTLPTTWCLPSVCGFPGDPICKTSEKQLIKRSWSRRKQMSRFKAGQPFQTKFWGNKTLKYDMDISKNRGCLPPNHPF